ncbi:sensor histidine kinase [Aquimonas sp.]|jgi:signal transduction histidine kinase|uniref:sensor histidine kinase n=1 Tax=Aquimonas sp. TaxID=1872588 RepID=UPI0037BF5C95
MAAASSALQAPAQATGARADAPRRLFWWLHIVGWLGYFGLSFLGALAHGKGLHYAMVPAATAIAGALGTGLLRPWLHRLRGRPMPQQLLLSAVPVLLASVLMGAAYIVVLIEYCSDCRPTSQLGYLAYAVSHLYVVLTWLGLYLGLTTYRQLQAESRRLLEANAMAHQAQLKMLRYQLNPHFLFNTLNAISTLILDRDTPTANAMVLGLSGFLRHSLDSDPMQRVSLRQELEAMQLYLGIERIRFDERLRLQTHIAADCFGALVPSLILQPLIENAIKYAVAPRIEGGSLWIEARRTGAQLVLTVRDDGPGCPHLRDDGALPPGNGVGLRNVFERVRVLYGESGSSRASNRPEGGLEVELRLPFELPRRDESLSNANA